MMIESMLTFFHALHAWVFETVILPLVRATGQTAFTNEAFNGTETFLLGMIEICVLYGFLRPLEKWRPAEARELAQERRTDSVYTLLHRLGGFALISFALLTPILDALESRLRLLGMGRLQLDDIAWLSANPIGLFLAYVCILDFCGYWIHRGQHRFHLWWQLHALHHANPSLSLWSDNRNHVLDDLWVDVLLGMVAWFIGVEPTQYVLLVLLTRLLQSLQHANVRLHYGAIGEHILVSPQFHRAHHAISSGNEGPARGCNFGVILACWDSLFGTAKHSAALEPTGVSDTRLGRDYGHGFWSQQRLGFLRLIRQA
jgi:sterol desaturase/sphingolipid hydroxylase (fatty acid hydroxylase superfamily)